MNLQTISFSPEQNVCNWGFDIFGRLLLSSIPWSIEVLQQAFPTEFSTQWKINALSLGRYILIVLEE